MRNTLLLIATLWLVVACREDKIKPFGDQDYAYFDIDDRDGSLLDKNNFLIQDYTFLLEFDETIERTIIDFPIRIVGTAKGHDRYVSIQVVDTLSSALEGLHYELLPNEDNRLEASETTGTVRVELIKTADMANKVYKLAFVIVDNEHLKAGPGNKIILSFHNTLEKPYWWPNPNLEIAIGEFSITKCLLWMQFHDVLDNTDPWEREPYAKWIELNPGQGDYYWNPNNEARSLSIAEFIRFLQQGDDAGNDYIDENGNRVLDTL